MNRLTFTILGASLVGLFASCGGGSSAVFGDAVWQVQCPAGSTGCPMGGDEVNVFNFDGDEGVTAECQVFDGGGDEIIVDLAVGYGRDPRLSITGLVTGTDGGPVRGQSVVTFTDDSNTYGGGTLGTAGANVPSDAQPCQISDVVVDRAGVDGPEIRFSLLCRSVPAAAAPTRLQRDLTRPRNSTEPAQIRMIFCEGL